MILETAAERTKGSNGPFPERRMAPRWQGPGFKYPGRARSGLIISNPYQGWLNHRPTFRQKTRDKFVKFVRKSCKNYINKARSCPEKLKVGQIELIRDPVSNSTCEEIDKKLDNTISSLQKWIAEFSEPCNKEKGTVHEIYNIMPKVIILTRATEFVLWWII